MILGNSIFQSEVLFNTSPEPYVPTVLVKIDTTATSNNKIKHQLPNWSGDTWTPYATSWEAYKNKTYVKYRVNGATIGDYTYPKHCFLVHESNDPNVPVGTKYGSACPTDIVAKTCPANSSIVNGLCECDTGYALVKGICQGSGGTSGRSDDDDDDATDCADENREDTLSGDCGDCLSGYVKDSTTSTCIPEEEEEETTPWILYGMLGAMGLGLLLVLKKK